MQVPDQRVLLLLSLILFSKKLFQKILYIALPNNCVNRAFWKNRAAFEVSLKVHWWARKFPWMKRSQIFFFLEMEVWQCYIKYWNWSFQIWNSHKFSYIIVANFSTFLSVRFALRLVSPERPPWLALRDQKIFWNFRPLEARKTLFSVKNLKISESY